MGKASSSKKVARAASTGGGRTVRGRATPWGWYSAIGMVCLLGIAGVVFSRGELGDKLNLRGGTQPRVGQHWHEAIGFYVCDRFAPNIPDNNVDQLGIHTHGDGVIHDHPFTRAASGKKATLKVFAATVGMTLDSHSFKLPGGKSYTNDKTTCDGKKGSQSMTVNGKQYTGNPASYHMNDGDKIVLAFTKPDTAIPKAPPSAEQLSHLVDVPGSPGATTTTVPGQPPAAGATTPPAGGAATPDPAEGTAPATTPGSSAPPGSAPAPAAGDAPPGGAPAPTPTSTP